ncbi:3577_t:CDS:2, partial [Racocetra fulgida]
MPKKTTLTDIQKRELCEYARDNKMKRSQYVDWIEKKWGIRVDESTISRILKTGEERLNSELLAEGLEIPQGALQFFNSWLEKFKDRNGIRQHHLEGEAESADEIAISNTLPMLKDKCSNYP